MRGAPTRFSAWTLMAPLALVACVYVVASIIAGTRWNLAGHDHVTSSTTRPAPVRVVRAYTTRAGDTWRRIARHHHISLARLHALNPRDTAKGRIVPGEHLLLEP